MPLRRAQRVWNHVHAYIGGGLVAVCTWLYSSTERAYIAPVPEEHLVWLWGLGCVVFLHHAYQARSRISMLLLVDHGFIKNIRDSGSPTFYRMVHNLRRARQTCDAGWTVSFVFSIFYYLIPNQYALPVWLGLSVTSFLLLRRANAMFDLAQGIYRPHKEAYDAPYDPS